MADDEGGEKTHEPTAKKQQEFRDKGNIPRSQDLFGVMTLAVGIPYLLVRQDLIGSQIMQFTQRLYGTLDQTDINQTQFLFLIQECLEVVVSVTMPLLCALWLGIVVAGLIQSRFIIPKEPIKINWETLNPIDGIKKKFFSWQPVIELVKGVLKLFLLVWLVWLGVKDEIVGLPSLINASPSEQIIKVTEIAEIIFWRALVLGIFVFLIDYAYNWWDNRQQMMMTHQEVKDEFKDAEGNPQFKSVRIQRQYDLAMGHIQNVANADVVLTNPTHFAVALRYRRDEAEAPIVIAKGVDFLAFRIRDAARMNNITVIENPPLARGLYFKSTVGQMIPPEFYAAVAEILAAVYRRRFL